MLMHPFYGKNQTGPIRRGNFIMKEEILSVGIDIGTSTTSMIVSKLSVQNTASYFTVPHVDITDKKIIYRSPIYQTPQDGSERIDIKKVEEIISTEYEKAGILPADVQTGAVIITGESSRKENARLVTNEMSRLAGEFVVASAGPDLESVIAGKGSGAQAYSEENAMTVVNIDVGGGTSNIAIFRNGELAERGCFDIGGRLIRFEDNRVCYISKRLKHIIEETGADLKLGDLFDIHKIKKITDRMAQILGESIGLKKETKACEESRTSESSHIKLPDRIDAISFSGGVADLIYHPREDYLCYQDIGVLLADSIRESSWLDRVKVISSAETIQATVIGAGSYTTSVSGSTITFTDNNIFPLKNIPAYVAARQAEEKLLTGNEYDYENEAKWYFEQSSADNIAFILSHIVSPSYKQIIQMADAFARMSEILPDGKPLLIICRDDFGKSLGMAISRVLKGKRGLVCIDGIHAVSGDYIDFGKPLMNGLVIPVVVKTLIFG